MPKRKAQTGPKFYWIVEGYDSTKKIFSTKFNVNLISERQIEPLLKALTARVGLELNEIIGCYFMKHTKLYRHHLEIRRDVNPEQRRNILTCGSNPHFVARVVKE